MGVALGSLLLAGPAPAATTLGGTQSDPFQNCSASGVENLVQPTSSGPSYTVPAPGGVITAWRHAGRGGAATSAGSGKLIIWRPTSDPAQFLVVGKSGSENFVPSTTVTYPARISVQGGDVLGLRAESFDVNCWISIQPDGLRSYTGPDPAIGTTQTFGATRFTQNVNVAAVLEPDADADGYGDETQDACPGTFGTDNGCALSTGQDPDTDGDGIPDSLDTCPAEAGPVSNNGCPVTDTQGLPLPVVGETANVENVTGSVTFKLPGSNQAINLDDTANVPTGTLFDTTRGKIRLTSEAPSGALRTGEFSRGVFRFLQDQSDRFITELKLARGSNGCKRQSPTRKPGKPGKCKPNHVWGDGGGGHQTTGNHGSGSTRGTKWLTSELRVGTRFTVKEGQIKVRDFEKDRTVRVSAGESYLARG